MSTATTSASARPIALVAGLIVGAAAPFAAHHWFGVSLALTTIVLFLLSLGEFSAYAPAVLSQHLPLFSNFRIPSRYTIPFLQFAVLTLAWAFQSLVHALPLTGTRRASPLASSCIGRHRAPAGRPINGTSSGVFTEPPFETTFRWMAGPREIATDQLTERVRSRDRRCCARSSRIARSSIAMSRCRCIARRIPIGPCCRCREPRASAM